MILSLIMPCFVQNVMSSGQFKHGQKHGHVKRRLFYMKRQKNHFVPWILKCSHSVPYTNIITNFQISPLISRRSSQLSGQSK